MCLPCRLKHAYTGNKQWSTVQEGCSRTINMLTSSTATGSTSCKIQWTTLAGLFINAGLVLYLLLCVTTDASTHCTSCLNDLFLSLSVCVSVVLCSKCLCLTLASVCPSSLPCSIRTSTTSIKAPFLPRDSCQQSSSANLMYVVRTYVRQLTIVLVSLQVILCDS